MKSVVNCSPCKIRARVENSKIISICYRDSPWTPTRMPERKVSTHCWSSSKKHTLLERQFHQRWIEHRRVFVNSRTVGEIVPILMSKCLSGRAKIKDRAFDILLTYIEIDKNAEIEDQLVAGLENKQPKIVQACLELLRRGLRYISPFFKHCFWTILWVFAVRSVQRFYQSNHSFPKSCHFSKIETKQCVTKPRPCSSRSTSGSGNKHSRQWYRMSSLFKYAREILHCLFTFVDVRCKSCKLNSTSLIWMAQINHDRHVSYVHNRMRNRNKGKLLRAVLVQMVVPVHQQLSMMVKLKVRIDSNDLEGLIEMSVL